MAPGSFNFRHPPELFKPFEKYSFGYDPARDGYWSTTTYTTNPYDSKLSSRAIEEAEKMLESAKRLWFNEPIRVDKKHWSKLFSVDWDIDVATPKMEMPPERGPLDDERDAERKRKIHNLFWARKQKDPNFNLV